MDKFLHVLTRSPNLFMARVNPNVELYLLCVSMYSWLARHTICLSSSTFRELQRSRDREHEGGAMFMFINYALCGHRY